MPKLQVFTFGTLSLKLDDETLTDFVSQKTVALFIYLLLHPRELPRDVLAELFWSETTGEQALKNLRTVLSNLQKRLSDYLEVTRQSISICQSDAIWCDAQVFEAQLDFLDDRHKHPISPTRQRQKLTEAVGLYQGDFLMGLKTDNAPQLDQWVSLERERLQRRFTQALYQLMTLCVAQGDFAAGLETGQRLISLEPFWEDAYRLQMNLYVQAGNRTAAVQLYDSLYDLLQTELDTEPEQETIDLVERIKNNQVRLLPSPQTLPNKLPNFSGHYIPVPKLVEGVEAWLDDPHCRLLTVLGIGGVGKTRLAHYVAQRRIPEYRDGVFFVALESLTGPEFVPQAVINVLNFARVDEMQTQQDALLDDLREKHMLLVLDNFEHVLAAADWVVQLLNECPYLQILVTSREQLHLAEEHIFTITGLPFAQHNETAPAIQLFASAASRINPAFDLQQTLPMVARICQLVEGLPLGILIAAGWVQFLTPEQIVQRIEDNLDFLALTRRDLPDRHQGIMALLNSTWETLSQAERDILMALAVFPSHFDLEAAMAIASTHLSTLISLVSKSLVSTDGSGRYQLHELLRRFTFQKAAEVGGVEAARQAHHTYYQRWIDELHAAYLPSHEQFAAIDREYHNLWYFDWLNREAQYQYILHLAKILPDYWIARGIHVQEGVELLRQALPSASGWLRANACVRFGRLLTQTGEFQEARKVLEEGLVLSQQAGDYILEALALSELKRVVSELGDLALAQEHLLKMVELYNSHAPIQDIVALREIFSRAYTNLSVVYLQSGKLEEAKQYGHLGLQKHREAKDRVGEALSLNTLGIIALDQGHYELAREYFESALTIAHAIHHHRHQTIFMGNLAEAFHRMGDFHGAFHQYREVFQKAHRMNNRKTMLNVLEQLANVALDLGQAEEAARYLGAALTLRETLGFAIQPRQKAEFATREARLTEAVGVENLHRLIEVGRTLTPIEISERLEKVSLPRFSDGKK
ncbi:MAG: tetratricopeptide repeat protein [Anaerolineae bacterium]|nr:tetratricopeptide repeat protein [Anaerolineae bacterium]